MKLMTRLRMLEQRKKRFTGCFMVFDHDDGTYSQLGVRYESIEAVYPAAPPGHLVVTSHIPDPKPLPPELARED